MENFNLEHLKAKQEGVDFNMIQLSLHQGTSLENAGEVAASLLNSNVSVDYVLQDISSAKKIYSGANACQFLSAALIDYATTIEGNFLDHKQDVENLIETVPEKINTERNIGELVDTETALEVLRSTNLITSKFQFEEQMAGFQEALLPSDVLTHLNNGLKKIICESRINAIYTCAPIAFTIRHI